MPSSTVKQRTVPFHKHPQTTSAAFSENTKFTGTGGHAVLMVAGEDLYQGEVVYLYTGAGAADLTVRKAPIDSDMPLGVVLEDATSGTDVWIVVGGIAYVKPTAAVTAARGYVIYCSGTTAGRVDQSATLPSAVVHNREVGHFIETGSAAGAVARAILHFN